MKLIDAFFQLLIGLALGLILLEGILQVNPKLLLRGMALPAPIDPPLLENNYDVRSSDADLFYWQPDLIRPISPEDNVLEAHVHYYTDEFGFPNPAPVSPYVDVVVLGRSYSMGAQATDPWTRLLEEKFGFSVFNLSQTGSNIHIKSQYFSKFGLPRHPKWVIIEVLPSMDIIGYEASQKSLLQSLPVPVIQQLFRNIRRNPTQTNNAGAIYPLKIKIPGGDVDVLFFSFYLESLTLDKGSLAKSSQWNDYKKGLTSLIELARSNGICVALLYVPTKENIYFQLSNNPNELKPVLNGWGAWKLNNMGELEQDNKMLPEINTMRRNTFAARDLVADFAEQCSIPFIDPTTSMMNAQGEGNNPFMEYDTHWSARGHNIVADLVAKSLSNAACP